MKTKKDLWGDIESTKNVTLPYPYTCLKEQGELLREKTNGLLIGELVINDAPIYNRPSNNILENLENRTVRDPSTEVRKNPVSQPEFCYYFIIKSTALRNYHYYVLEIASKNIPYPVYITDLTKEDIDPKKCDNQEQFYEMIESILSSNIVKQTIAMLLEQSKKNTTEND
jgi:hypothetical protein